MSVFFTSDNHFSHANIIRYCDRPFKNVDEMNEAMVDRWNQRVLPSDFVYHLGDFAMGPSGEAAKYRARLNGKIILILGNHDRSRKHMLAAGFDQVYQEWKLDIKVGLGVIPLYLSHRPPHTDNWMKHSYYYLCGHVHTLWHRQGNVINVGVDLNGFEPKTLEELLKSKDVLYYE